MEEQAANSSNVLLPIGQNMFPTGGNAPTLKTVLHHHLTHSLHYFLHALHFLQNPPIQIINHPAFAQNVHPVLLTLSHRPLSHDVHLCPVRQTQIHLFIKNAHHACYHASSLLSHPPQQSQIHLQKVVYLLLNCTCT